MWNKIKSFFGFGRDVEQALREEQEAYFAVNGRYLQLSRDGFRVDVFEAPGPERGKSVHGYNIRRG